MSVIDIKFTKALLAGIIMTGVSASAFSQNFQSSQNLPVERFLPAELLKSPHHRVNPRVDATGLAAIFTIETPQQTYTVEGRQNAINLIKEIEATAILRERSTVGAAANSAVNRTTNLVRTPVRIVEQVGDRIDSVSSVEEALLLVPQGVGDVAGRLMQGIGELGVTGVRIAKGAAGTKCQGFNCVEKAGEDIWSGVNSLVGKHNASRRLHAELGTDPETQNKALKRQVDRLAYADAYTGTAYKLGLGTAYANIDYFSPMVTGVGYINNAEFLGQYKDAHRGRNADKAALRAWGVTDATITRLYKNTSYTKAMRRDLVAALSALPDPEQRAKRIVAVTDAATPYIAQSNLRTFQYLASIAQTDDLVGLVPDTPISIAQIRNGALILPYVSDYLLWTVDSARPLDTLTQAKQIGQSAEIHVIGKASSEFKQQAQTRGIAVREIS